MGYDRDTTMQKSYVYKNKGEDRVQETTESVGKLPILPIPDYGITKEGAEYFQVRSAVSEVDGQTVTATYYPYYNQKNKISGYKKVNWTIPKKQKGRFTAVGDIGIDCKLFGQHQAEKVKRRKTTLIYLEGEGNVVTGWQAIMESTRGTKYSDLQPHIVGLSCGTANAVSATIVNEQFVREFEKPENGKIVLGFDNDCATPKEAEKGVQKGVEAIENVAGHLMSDKVYTYDYGNFNDPRDMYTDGNAKGLGSLLTFGMKKYHPEKIVNIGDISFEELTKPRQEGFHIPAFPELNAKLHGFRTGELVIMTAPSGAGKSSIVSEFAYSLTQDHNQKLGMIYLEEIIEETTLRFIARYLGINYNNGFKFNPLKYVSEEDFRKGMEAIKDSGVLVDHFGSIAISLLMKKIKYMEHVDKVNFIILDHLSMIFSATKTDNERKLIDELMTELASYVAKSSIGVIAISHMGRIHGELDTDKEGKAIPTWVRVRKEQLRGSASLEQLSWVVLAIEPELMPDRSRGRVRLVVLKNRPWSYTGTADVVAMDETTGKFISCPDEEF